MTILRLRFADMLRRQRSVGTAAKPLQIGRSFHFGIKKNYSGFSILALTGKSGAGKYPDCQ
jgi:hypothetical protein